MESSCNAIILAGGKSERMGFPKPFLDFDGKTFVEKLTETYRKAGIGFITVVLNRNCIQPNWKNVLEKINSHVELVVNENEQKGRLHSIQLGLRSFPKMQHCFIQNVDNPFTSVSLLQGLTRNKKKDHYSVPIYKNKGGHPILISENIISSILQKENTEMSLREILSSYKRNEYVVDDPTILLNINTPEEYHNQSQFRSSISI